MEVVEKREFKTAKSKLDVYGFAAILEKLCVKSRF